MKIFNKCICIGFIFLITFPIFPQQSQAQVPPEPSLSRVVGHQLMVRKRLPNGELDFEYPYVMKGVTWQPATRATSFFFGDPTGFVNWLRSQPFIHYTLDVPLLRDMNVNTVRVYNDFGDNQVAFRQILDEFYRNDIMVVMTIVNSKAEIDVNKHLTIVNAFKDHPAILMWAIGNEWNFDFHLFFDRTTIRNVQEATALVNRVAQEIKGADPQHAVTSALGDRFSEGTTMRDIVLNALNIDIWGLNIYRGSSFNSPQGNVFTQWQSLWNQAPDGTPSKPFYFSEFGTDSFQTTARRVVDGNKADDVQGSEDPALQATTDINLWLQIQSHLAIPGNNERCTGGFVHEFNDELWKVGNPHVGLVGLNDFADSYRRQDREGFIAGHPDGVANEEFFGVVNADRQPKEAFNQLTEVFHENTFIRGDSNCDGGVDLSDPIHALTYLFKDGATPLCLDAADSNDDGGVDISDAVKSLLVLFVGAQMPSPYPTFGRDPSLDTLSCEVSCPP